MLNIPVNGYFFSKNPKMSNPITFSDFTLDFKMCHMPKKDKFVANSKKNQKKIAFFPDLWFNNFQAQKGISYHFLLLSVSDFFPLSVFVF